MAATNGKDDFEALENAEDIIERFGGIRPMAKKMDVAVTTVQGWKKRGVIPGNRRADVLSAAQVHKVDLGDLTDGKGIANQNDFSQSLEAAEKELPSNQARHDAAIAAASETAKQDEARACGLSGTLTGEELMNEIRKAESKAVGKSIWLTVFLIFVACGTITVLLWPGKQQIEQQGQEIAVIRGDVADVKKEQSFLKKLVPADMQDRISALRDQAESLQATVTTLSQTAQGLAQDMTDPNAGPISARIGRLEQQMTALGAPADLTAVLAKLQALQQTVEGQTQLSTSVTDLQNLVSGLQGRMDHLDGALMEAQQEDDALGQTLEGVSANDLKAAAMLLGLSQFRSSLNRNAPFEDDLVLLQNLLGDDDPELNLAIERLALQASRGVLTPDGLSSEFRGLAGDIVVSSLKGEDVSIQEKAKARLNDVLQVEKDGELITGTDTQASVARAQKMLDEGDVPGALAELKALEGEASVTAQPFINEAEMTLMAQELQSMLTEKVASRVDAGGQGLNAADLKRMLRDIQGMAPARKVVGDEESGIYILPPQPKMPSLPDISLDR
ncbi:MAG: uroporphyrinogen III synthase HEM4 [Rhodospirillales bacterium]|nr:uroporphyrinogen III synthase HEM4 [Rhodospirillales bacterium]